MAEFTQFDYLLNAYTAAAQADKPADHDYKGKREALFAHVRQLEANAALLRSQQPVSGGEREAFEQAMRKRHSLTGAYFERNENGYRNEATESAWHGWQAARLSAPQAVGWLPIDSAPKDGAEFIAAIEVHNVVTGARWWERHSLVVDDDGEINRDRFMGWDLEDYAGWQPLPPPPTQQGDSNG